MFDFLKKSWTDVLDKIENAVYEELKTNGFRRYGRIWQTFPCWLRSWVRVL